MKCQQCGQPAFVKIHDEDSEVFLCIDCNLKFEQGELLEFQRTAQQLNLMTAMFEGTVGLTGMMPRVNLPTIKTATVAPMSFNNIHVDRSTVGVINTGSIRSLDSAVTVLKESGSVDVATAITKLTQAVVDTAEIKQETRNEIIELLGAIAEEAGKPKEQRRGAVARAMISDVATAIGALAGVSDLWNQFGPVIQSYFA